MRIHRLELTGVGPFKDRQVIDFDPLADAGLFLIDGPTGTGKSTIIDAIVYALFGVVSGSSDLDRIRSTFCSEDDPTGVKCTFSVDGRRHAISRVPRGARDPNEPNKKAKSAAARQVLIELAADGTEMKSMVRDDEIRQHIEGLLRMNADQFRRLVVLPQGKFAELLVMKPKDRLEALGSLLGEEFFDRLQDELQAEGDRAKERRSAATAAVTQACERLAGRLAAYLGSAGERAEGEGTDFTDEAVPEADRIAAVDALLTGLTDQADRAQVDRTKAQQAAAAAEAAAAAAERLVQALEGIGAAQEAVQLARTELDAADAGIEDVAVTTRIGELRQLAGGLEGHAQWESESDARAAARAAKAAKEASCRDSLAQLQAEQGQFPQVRAQLSARKDQATTQAAALASAAADRERITGLLDKARQLEALAPRQEQALAALAESQAAGQRADTDLEAATSTWHGLVRAQLEQQAAHLAQQLVDGAPCPVCGSGNHPDPARPADGTQMVAEEAINLAQQAVDEAKRAQQQAQQRVVIDQDAAQANSDQLATLRGALGSTTGAALSAELTAVEERLELARAAEKSLEDLGQELELLANREQAIGEQITATAAQAAGLASELALLDQVEQERMAQIRVLIGEAASATDLLRSTQRRVDALEALGEALTMLAEAAAAVPAEDRTQPLAQAHNAAEEARATADAAEAARNRADEAALVLVDAVRDATPLAEAFRSSLQERSTASEATKDAIFLADLATARSSANTRGLQLRSYALQRRFEGVLQASSHHLHRMSSGRFSLELNEDRAGAGHSGLGIAVFDSWSGTRQDPKSLSGGETFYAALSLALGLAEVIRSETGGSALETLFVDEGFGSLDQDTLYRVLEQLDQLRAGGRAVGVVSHVTEMKEQIAERIEVRRQPDNTSTISVPGAAAAR